MLAACSKDEDLPQNPNLPADLFTACLTTPIRMALRWHWLRHQEYFPGKSYSLFLSLKKWILMLDKWN